MKILSIAIFIALLPLFTFSNISQFQNNDNTILINNVQDIFNNIKPLLDDNWNMKIFRIDEGGSAIIINSKKEYDFKIVYKYDVHRSHSIVIDLNPKCTQDFICSKIKTETRIKNEMKTIFEKLFPHYVFDITKFRKLSKENVDSILVSKYNSLSDDLWINDNNFPKFYSSNFTVVIKTEPNILFAPLDSLPDLRKLTTKIESLLMKYDSTYCK
jgi:hypothetical protein